MAFTAHEGTPYPKEGMKQIIADFEEAFLCWACHDYQFKHNGTPNTKGYFLMNHVEIFCLDHHFSSNSDYTILIRCIDCPVRLFGVFDSSERQILENYASRMGLTANIRIEHAYHTYWVISLSGKLRCSGMNYVIDQMKNRIKKAVPLAQKFYSLPLLDEITRKTTVKTSYNQEENRWWTGSFSKRGTFFPTTTDSDGYTYSSKYTGFSFSQFGYRDLANDDEIIAFALASTCRCGYKIEPKDLDLQYLKWYCVVKDGVLKETPSSYHKPQPASSPKPLKDFF